MNSAGELNTRVQRWRTIPLRHNRLLSVACANIFADILPTQENLVDYFFAFADSVFAPIHCVVEVARV